MPVFLRKDEENGGIVAVWHISESVEELTSALNLREVDLQKVNSFRLDIRKQEFLATRCLIKEILAIEPEIDYLDTGRPVLKNSTYKLSISHTQNYAAISLSKNKQVGIDIEYPSHRVSKVFKRFISDEEHSFIPADKEVEYFTLIWCLKESMYKLFDEKSIIFNLHLKCMPFKLANEGELDALFCMNKEVKLKYKYLTTNKFYLVYHC